MSAQFSEAEIVIRPMREVDLEAVLVNEEAAYTHPWTRTIVHDCMRVGYHCQVMAQGPLLLGHAVLSAAAGEAHLLNITIAPEQQGRGLGRRLLHRMVRLAAAAQADTVFLEVRVSNLAAQHLYESEGFCEIAQRRNYYPHDDQGREDAVIYAKPLSE